MYVNKYVNMRTSVNYDNYNGNYKIGYNKYVNS